MIIHSSILRALLLSAGMIFHLPFQPAFTALSQSNGKDNNSLIRQNATLVLDSVIDELKQVEDVTARVALAETIVKSLSASRPERCRQLLDSLFNDVLQLKSAGASEHLEKAPDPDSLIRKIIQIAAAYNPKLAQSYIDKYTSEENSRDVETSTSKEAQSQAAVLQLKLATELIDKDPALAVSAGERSLKSAVLPETLVFLSKLRKKDAASARNFFTAALQSIKARHGNNVNELLLLYAYLFSPLHVPQVVPQGLAFLSLPDYPDLTEKYTFDSALAQQYLNVSAQILFEAARYHQSPALGTTGDLYLINLLEPQASAYLPTLAQPLSEKRYALMGQINPDQRNTLQAATDRWNNLPSQTNPSSGSNLETMDYLLQRAEKLSDLKRKNQTYYRAAMAAVEAKKYEIAMEIVAKLSPESREEAKQFISFSIASSAARHHQTERAEQLARRDDDLARRAYIFTMIASSLLEDKSMNIARASEFLNEVEQLAPKLSNQERLPVLVGASIIYSRFNIPRAAEFLREAIKAANNLEGFTGYTYIDRTLEIGGFYFDYSMYADEFTFIEAIARIGLKDFNGTLQDLRELKSRLPRLRAIVALCSGVLSKTSRSRAKGAA